MTTPKVLLKRSSVIGRVPQSADLEYGELAINFADGKIYYKNSSNTIKSFIDSSRVQALIDAVNQAAEDQLDSAEVISLIDSAYIQLRQSYDATLLNGDSAGFYREYPNLRNKPVILDIIDVQNIIDDYVDVNFIDNLNTDADTLDGLNSTQFLRSDSDTTLTADLTIDSNLTVGGDATFNNDVTLSGNLYGPATMYIDPAAHDSDTGRVIIRGDLQVDGTQTIVNSTTVSINDKNIILADSAADSAAADGAGITVNGANAKITYNAAEDEWQFNKKAQAPNLEVTNVIDATTVNTTNISATTINTTNITGNYTNFDSDFDSALGTKTTSNLTEGDNLYYTTARADSDARSALSARKISGFGDLTYDSAAGKFSYTGVSTQEVRNQFSAQGDLSYDSSTGVFSIDVETVYTKANFDSDLGDASTDDLPEGDNLYYTTTRHDSDFDVRFATKTTDNLTEGSTNLYYTKARVDSDVATSLGDSTNVVYTTILNVIDSSYVQARVDSSFIAQIADLSFLDSADALQLIDSSHVQLKAKGLDYNVLSNKPALIDSALVTQLIDSTYIRVTIDSAHIENVINNSTTVFENNVDSSYVQLKAKGLDYDVLSNKPTLIDSNLVTQLVDSAYVQQRVSFETSGYGGLKLMSASTDNTANTLTWTFNTDAQAENFRELVHGTTQPANSVGTRLFFYDADGYWYRIGASGFSKSVVRRYQVTRTNSVAVVEFDSSQDDMLTSTSNPSGFPAVGVELIQLRNINDPNNPGTFGDPYELGETIQSTDIAAGYYGESAQVFGVLSSTTFNTTVSTIITTDVDSAYVQLHAKGLDYNVLSNKPALIDSTLVTQLIDSAYIKLNTDSAFVENIINNSTTVFENNVDSAYVQLHAKGLNYNVLSNKPNVLDSSDIVSIIVSETLDSDLIINLVDSAYIQLRDRFQDSTGVKAVIDSAYVRARVKTDQNLRTIDSVSFAGITVSANSITWGESDATMTYLPDSDMIEFNKAVKGEQVQFTGATIQSDSGTFNGLYVYDNRRGQKDWVARFSRRQNEYSSPAVVLISTDAEQRSDLALEIRGNANSNLLGPEFDDGFHDDSNTTFAVYGSGHTLIGYSNLPGGVGALYPYSMLAGDNNIRLQVKHGISVDSNLVIHAGNYTNYIDSAYIEARRPAETIFSVGGDGSNYVFSGDGFPSNANDPTLYLTRGKTYKFTNISSSHPFEIRLSNGGTAYSDGVTNNGGSGTVEFTVPMDAPTSLVYQCTIHGGMVGNIVINAAAGLDSAQIINLIDSAYVQLRDSSNGGGGGGGGVDSATTIALIDSAYVKARVDHNGNEKLIFGDDQAVTGTLSGGSSGTQITSFGPSVIPPNSQFTASYDYANGGLPIGQWLYGEYWVNSAVGYFQVQSKTDNGAVAGTYTYYTSYVNWPGGWTTRVHLASVSGERQKALEISHQTNGDYILFNGQRNFHFFQSDSQDRDFKIELTGNSVVRLVGGGHIHYGNSYDSDGDFPDGTIYKGMTAHAKNNDAMYYANDSGVWTTIAGTGAQAFNDSAVVEEIIDSDYILGKKFVPGDAERRIDIRSTEPTKQHAIGDYWLDRDNEVLYKLGASTTWSSTFPAYTYGGYANLSTFDFGSHTTASTGSFNIASPNGPSGTFTATWKTGGTTGNNTGFQATFNNPVIFGYYYIGNSVAGWVHRVDYEDGSFAKANGNANTQATSVVWYEANGQAMTGADAKSFSIGNSGATTQDWNHPRGTKAVSLVYGRSNYGTRNYDAYLFFNGDNFYQRVGEIYDSGDIKALIDSAYVTGISGSGGSGGGLDSAAVITLIDSAYVQARQTAGGGGGTDSAAVQTLIDAALDSGAVPFTQKYFHFTSDSGHKIYSGFDDDSDNLTYTAGALSVYLNGILLVDSVDYTATNGTSIVLADSAELGDILTVQTFAGNSFGLDSAQTINLIDSAYINARVTASASGGTDSAAVINLIDSAYINARVDPFDSSHVLNLVDSAYIQLRDRFQDSAGINAVVDSAYVRQRVTQSDLDMLGNKVLFANVYDSTGSFPSASTYHGMFAHAHNTGAGYFAHAGAWTRLANHSDLNSYSDSDVLVLVDSAYVQARQTTGGGTVDSADIIAIVDSAYVQARQTSGGGGGGIDSAAVITLIDSDYIGSKVDFTRGEFTTQRSQYTATAAQTVFNHSSIDATHLDVYLNGILQVVNDDYTANTSAVTFTTGVDSGYSVSIIERRGRVATQQGLIETKYYFTTATPTTTITGTDDNGVTLDYSVGGLDVYLNGILLKDSDDYSTNAGTSVTFVSATDSNDLITLVNRKGIIVSPTVKNYEFTADSDQTIFLGSDINGNTLSYVPGAIQVHMNGIILRATDYAATNGSSINLVTAANVNDELVVSAFSNPGHNMELYKFIADSDQTIFHGNDLSGAALAYSPGNIQVFMNGLLLNDSDDYIASNGISVTLTSGADLSDEIKIASFVTNSDTIRTNAWSAPSSTPVAASAGDKLFIDTSSAKTVTLPSSASMGDEIRIIDVTGNASTNNITVSRNGHKIQGAASDLTINVDRAGIGLVYYNAAQGWVLIEN